MDLRRWLTWWIAEDPRPRYSALDRMDGVGARRRHVPRRCHNAQLSRGRPSPGLGSDRVEQPGE